MVPFTEGFLEVAIEISFIYSFINLLRNIDPERNEKIFKRYFSNLISSNSNYLFFS